MKSFNRKVQQQIPKRESRVIRKMLLFHSMQLADLKAKQVVNL